MTKRRLQSLREHVRTSLWFMPALFALGAVLLAFILLNVDRQLSSTASFLVVYGGGADGARGVLSTIAQSMLTFTGLVFTITMLVLQLASTQLSPRVMRTFLRDRNNQAVLGLFVATFVYTLLILRDVRAEADGSDAFVPGLAIWVAFALLLASVAAFIYYIDHMAHAIRASTVIANIAHETEQAIERLYPEGVGARGAEGRRRSEIVEDAGVVLKAPRAGVLVSVDDGSLLRTADARDRSVEVLPAIGEFLPYGAPMARLSGHWDREAADAIRAALVIEDERSMDQDAAFGFRQLVDIAVRALSPGTNDPTTAVQALDRLHDLLRRLIGREFPSPVRRDDSGRVLLVLPRPDWADYVELAVDEIRLAGESQLQIGRRLRYLLEDLLSVAPDDRKAVLRRELALLESVVGGRRTWPEPGDDQSTEPAPS
ncbi:MAG TPA: DUF2254 domain-containing protein [Candidatus Limnocylindria bacterium]|nr:DUF2254 domain-containing protein [Candidatus Limnocylindria bacterium]